MKAFIEFGIRGGLHSGTIHMSSLKEAAKLAASLQRFISKEITTSEKTWLLDNNHPRISWQSSEHFITITKNDGIMRGESPAWKKCIKQ